MTLPDSDEPLQNGVRASAQPDREGAPPDRRDQPDRHQEPASTVLANGRTTASRDGGGSFRRSPPQLADTRFGGVAAHVEVSVRLSVDRMLGSLEAPFAVTATDLGNLGAERTRAALADLLQLGVIDDGADADEEVVGRKKPTTDGAEEDDDAVAKVKIEVHPEKYDSYDNGDGDVEAPKAAFFSSGSGDALRRDVAELLRKMRTEDDDEAADMAANVLASVVLRSSPESGIDPREVEHRRATFGTNAIAEKETDSFLKLCWEAVQDFVLIMLIVLGIISIVVEVTTHEGGCATCWIEGAAILCSVCIVVLVTAGIDYAKQFAFLRLTRSLHDTNTKQVVRDARQVSVTDDDIVVGDILSVNSHNLASIPADCVLLGPPGDLKMNESSLTGESRLVSKKPGDVILSGTSASQGGGRMVVIAVGIHSVAGKIKAHVYESADHEGELESDDENSPLFVKLDLIARRIGMGGTVAALVAFIGSCIIGLGIEGDDLEHIIDYLVTAITVLAVAVPEGLPLAVTLALAFSSNKMMRDQNLVKHLDACETMGCATTICTDKTGTLTANKMTARALFAGQHNFLVDDPAVTLGDYVREAHCSPDLVELICRTIAIDTMNETVLYYKEDKEEHQEGGGGGHRSKIIDTDKTVSGGSGNPTEVALLHLAHDLGHSYQTIRNKTKGRSDQGALGEFLALGKQYEFTSARKMMSWAVPREDGGYRLFCKGASEVVLARCDKYRSENDENVAYSEDLKKEALEVALAYARRGMRCLALAYRDLPAGFDLEATNADVTNSDGSDAFEAETGMTSISLVGIEDPLRPEVPGAIEKCYQAGIDVRLVTGDNPSTAVSIAYQAGILRDFHFLDGTTERVADNLKENVLMEGRDFRSKVYRPSTTEGNKKEFDQAAFDKIWPHLRVLARSSPDDKLTLAHGLNQSNLFADKEFCRKLEMEEGIKIFPDRQVVAMTGDGTNDAPALKRADIGFAMGIAGTQIAKDAADIILLDDNFASIVTSAKWGRNVYASIQKFLQFQLTVNISAVITALVGAFAYQMSPLAAIQLLWVNLLMDSLASLALASEPPVDALLQKPPVNRTDSMITKHMWANMIGQAIYQVTVVMTLLFAGPSMLNLTPGHIAEDDDELSVHYTLIFNSFVWMQLFNEVNCRKLKGEFNVFSGMLDNYLFVGILFTTAVLQALIVEFGYVAFRCAKGGLDAEYWALSLILGALSLPVQQLINFIYRCGQRYNIYKNKKRKQKYGHLSTQKINGAAGSGSAEQHAHAE